MATPLIKHANINKATLLGLAVFSGAFISPTIASEAAYRTHRVVQGDSLYSLAHHYTGNSKEWPVIQRLNHIKNPLRLKPGTKLLVPGPNASVQVVFVEGDVNLISRNTPHVIEVGEKLNEGDEIRVGSNSYLSVQFADGSIARVFSNTQFELSTIRESTKPVRRLLKLQNGNFDISVTPQKSSRPKNSHPTTLEILTPGAVAAVRGTRFDVSVSETGDMTSGVTKGIVGIKSNFSKPISSQETRLNAGTGIPVDAHGKKGNIRPLLPVLDMTSFKGSFDQDFATFSWADIPGAQQYQITIARDEALEDVVQNIQSESANINMTGLNNGDYFISIRGIDKDQIRGYEAHTLAHIKATPAFPLNIWPREGSILSNTFTLTCAGVYGATGYHIQVSSNVDFSSPEIDVPNTSECSYEGTLPDGQYYWRVATREPFVDDAQTEGPFSPYSSFQIKGSAQPSEAPEKPVLSWKSPTGFTYTAKISQDPHFFNEANTIRLNDNELNTEAYPPGKYYLQLQAIDQHGVLGNTTQPRIFEIKESNTPVIERTWFDKQK